MDSKLIEICYKKYNKEISDNWDKIASEYTTSSGEALRSKFKKYRKANGNTQEQKVVVDNVEVQPEVVRDYEIEKKISDLDLKEINLKKERIKLQDLRSSLNATIRKTARYENLIDEFKEAMQSCDLKNYEYIPHGIDCNNKSIVACFSDFHYGYKIDNSFNKYDTEIFKERFNRYISRIMDIGKQHNIGKIYVLGLGDYVSGEIHQSLANQNSIDVVKQTQEVSEHIADGLYALSLEFNDVHFYSVIGNHGRVNPSKPDNVYTNNFEKIIPWYVKSRLSEVKNIKIHDNTIDEGIGMIHTNNQQIVFTHGDNDSMTNIVASLSLTLGTIMTDVFVGHKHHFQTDVVNGVNVIMSGSICGTDEYAKNIRRTGVACQTVAIYNNLGLECLYNVVLS